MLVKKICPGKELSLLILLIYKLLWLEYFIACVRSCIKTAVICIDDMMISYQRRLILMPAVDSIVFQYSG